MLMVRVCCVCVQVKNKYDEGVKELATREHVKFVFRAYEELRSVCDGFDKFVCSIVLLYAIQRGTEK